MQEGDHGAPELQWAQDEFEQNILTELAAHWAAKESMPGNVTPTITGVPGSWMQRVGVDKRTKDLCGSDNKCKNAQESGG